MLKTIARTYDLSLVHARSMLRAGGFFFFFVCGVTTFKSATNALFLARKDPTLLPYLYLATAFAVTVVTVGLGKQLARRPAKPVLRQAVLLTAGLVFALAVLAAFDVGYSLGALYVAGEVYATALNVLFWARLGEVFDVRAGKKVFGVIAAAGMGGAVLGGLGVRFLAGVVPSIGWCFFAALTLVAVRPMLGRGIGGGGGGRKTLSLLDGLAYATKDRYPRGVAVLVLLLAVQTAAVDYAFRTGAVLTEAGDEAALAGLFGSLNAVVGVGAIAFQTTLTRPLLSRLGVFAFLCVVPGLALLASGAYAISAAFLPLFLLKTFEMMGSLSLNQPAIGLLYNPMPTAMRDSVRALVDGAVKKLGGAVGGVVLLVFGAALDPQLLVGLVAGLAVLILVWVRALRPSYLSALERKLGARVGRSAYIDASDRATRDRLLATLEAPDGGTVLAALDVLERSPKVRLVDHVGTLIAHPDDRVRTRGIALMRAEPDPRHAPLLEAMLDREHGRPSAEAARALAAVSPERARVRLEPFLDESKDLRLVCAAIEALLPEGLDGPDWQDSAAGRRLEALFARGRSSPPAERRELVRLLRHLGPGPLAWRLATFVDDPVPWVRAKAIRAAGVARDPALPPKLLYRLEDRRHRSDVIDALARYGDEVVPLLRQTLDDRRLPTSLRAQVPKVLRKVGTSLAVDAMLYSNVNDDAFLRYTIVNELSRLHRERPEVHFDPERVQQAALRRLNAYAHYRPMAMDLAVGGPKYGLLRRAVEDRVRQNLQAALRILGLVYDRSALEGALKGLERGAYADAIELLDVALEGSGLRAKVLSKLETSVPSAVPARATERAFALVEGRDVQLAAIAHQTLIRVGEHPPEVQEPTQGEPLMPKSILDRVFVLETVQLFHNLPVDDLAAVAELCGEGHASPREVVYREGAAGDSMYIILSGEVHLTRRGEPLLDLYAGDSFGQVSILDGGLRPVTAHAGDEGVEYLLLEREPFMDLLVDRPEVVNGLFEVLARRLRELVDLSGGPTGAGRAQPALSQLPGRSAMLSVPPAADSMIDDRA